MEVTYDDCESDVYYLDEYVEGRPIVAIYVDRITADMNGESLAMQYEEKIGAEGKTIPLGAHDYAATYLREAEGAGSNDAVVEYYITEQNGTVFRIRVCNFVDGQEGFGARMSAMLNTITF